MTLALTTALAIMLSAAAWATEKATTPAVKADRVVIVKSAHTLSLLRGGLSWLKSLKNVSKEGELVNALAQISKNSAKHIEKHLDEFKTLDPKITLNETVQIGQKIISNPANQVRPRVFEAVVEIGGQSTKVRAVTGGAGQLRSVYIPK